MDGRAINLLAGATITHPTKGRIPFQPYPYQRALWRDPALRRTVVHDPQMGVSTALMMEAVALCCQWPGLRIAVVTANAMSGKRAIALALDAYRGLPTRPETARQRGAFTLRFGNASEIFVASTLRGVALNRAIFEEFPYLPDMQHAADDIAGALSIGAHITVTGRERLTPDTPLGAELDRMFASRSFQWSHHTARYTLRPVGSGQGMSEFSIEPPKLWRV